MRWMRRKESSPRFVVCIDNSGCETSLELHKIYAVVPDAAAVEDDDLRVIDDSGTGRVYTAARFLEIQIPGALARAMLRRVP